MVCLTSTLLNAFRACCSAVMTDPGFLLMSSLSARDLNEPRPFRGRVVASVIEICLCAEPGSLVPTMFMTRETIGVIGASAQSWGNFCADHATLGALFARIAMATAHTVVGAPSMLSGD